jgi:4-hydroxybenzoate polyprenyltransferase
MVLNDVFDADMDARDRPERPIPSGRVSLSAATFAGWVLLVGGVLFASTASYMVGNHGPALIALLLAICIVLYDRMLKQTPAAPIVMGACRAFNVFLGMSLAIVGKPGNLFPAWSLQERLIAAGIGIYIVGVTLFARTEARTSSQLRLVTGLTVLLGGMALLAAVPDLTENRPRLAVGSNGWYLLWGVLALVTARRCVIAILDPTPPRVQAAVRHCVQSIIVLDAAVCAGYAGPYWGLAVLALIFPTLLMAMWLRAT